jgi:O-antigen/teichoic acid export membrane protein
VIGKFKASPLIARLLTGATWGIVGAAIASIANLLLAILLARMIGKEEYGKFVLVQSTIAAIGVIAGFGVGTVATRFVAELKGKDAQRLARILTLITIVSLLVGIAAAAVLNVFSKGISSKALNLPDLAFPLSIAAITIVFSTLDALQKCILVGLEEMKALAKSLIFGSMLSLPILFYAASTFGLTGLVFGWVVASAGQFLVTSAYCRRALINLRQPRWQSGFLSEFAIMGDYALPTLLASIVIAPAHWLCQTFLANTPGGIAEVAILGISLQWFNAVMFLPAASNKIVLPVLTERLSNSLHNDAKKLLIFAMIGNVVVTLPVSGMMVYFSSSIIGLYGPDFSAGSTSVSLAAMTAVLLAIQAPVGNIIIAASRIWIGAFMNFGWAIIFVGVAYHLIHLGAAGIMTGLIIAYAVHSIWTLTFAIRLIKQRESLIALQ